MAVNAERMRGGTAPAGVFGRLTTETKQAFKTTEFWAFVGVLAGILVAAWIIDGDGAGDPFRADDAWRYVTFLTIGYMVSRGLAKAGSREPYWADRDDLPEGRGRP